VLTVVIGHLRWDVEAICDLLRRECPCSDIERSGDQATGRDRAECVLFHTGMLVGSAGEVLVFLKQV
jgi:hypothetical protein